MFSALEGKVLATWCFYPLGGQKLEEGSRRIYLEFRYSFQLYFQVWWIHK